MTASAPFDSLFLRLQALLAGRFSLEREIGRGGMGIVYLARDVALERPVAIKVLAPAMAARPEMRERFLREARIAAQCFHPHIVPIHAVEEADDLAWIVMAYVRGETLADHVRRTGPLSPPEVLRLAREVGWALAYAHQRGVVHRDIKPENLLIDASTGRYVIADFGIAQGADQHRTPSGGSVPGTARYMAPEQALGEPIDGRADLYALGVTLFVAASGRAPFEAASAMALVAQHASQPAPSIRLYAPTIPLTLARAIDRCLAKQPRDRYADAGAFLAAIEPDVREQPLATALHAARDHASAARTMLFWAIVIALTSLAFVAGEAPRSLGRSIIISIAQSVVVMFTAASAIRAGEAMLEARRLIKLGHPSDDVTRALTGNAPDAATGDRTVHDRAVRDRAVRHGAFTLATGVALAYAQGGLSSVIDLPTMLQGVVQGLFLFLPPVLVARGANAVLKGTTVGAWLRDRLMSPIARGTTSVLRRLTGRAAPARPYEGLADAPTEMLLLKAVETAVGALPSAQRDALGDADGLARKLARQIASLRAEGQRVDAREAAALLLRDSAARHQQLESVRAERATQQARLKTAMTALECLRLDVLQVGADRSDSGLTDQLEQVRDVQRRVDAARDVRQLLRTPTPG